MDDGIHLGLGTGLRVYDLDAVLRCAACGINSPRFGVCFFLPLSRMVRVMKALIPKALPPSNPRSRASSLAPLLLGWKPKKSFLPSMTEKTPSQNLALDRQSHSGICSPHLKWYLLFSRGREGSKVIAKYRFFHALSKRTHTTFFLYTIYYRYFFYHSQGCSYDLRNKLVTKAHPLKTCTFKGRYHLLERHWCNWVASKNMAEVDLPRGLGLLNIFERKKKTKSFHPAQSCVKAALCCPSFAFVNSPSRHVVQEPQFAMFFNLTPTSSCNSSSLHSPFPHQGVLCFSHAGKDKTQPEKES